MITTTQTFYDNSIYKYRSTRAEVEVDTIDLTAKSNISSIVVNNQTYFYSSQIKDDITTTPNYATCEQNEFLLDGGREILPSTITNQQLGWWTPIGDSSGGFSTNPIITISFSTTHSTIGLTFFYDEFSYPLEYKVRWYNGSTQLKEKTYVGSSCEQVVNEPTTNFNKIELEITKSKPNAYVKLLEVNYGVLITFDGEDLQGTKINEEVSLMSNQLTSDSLSFSIINYDDTYDLLSPEDLMVFFTKGQTIYAKAGVLNRSTNEYEYISMGKFYIDSLENKNGLLSVKAYGVLNLLNEENFYSQFYENATVEDILEDILDGYDYYVHENIKDVTLTGYIPLQSKKEALKVLAIASNGVVKEGRGGLIYFYKATEDLSHNQIVTEDTIYTRVSNAPFLVAGVPCIQATIEPYEDVLTITRDQRLSSIDVSQIGYYHKVEVVQKNYTKDGTSETLFDDSVTTDDEGMAIVDFNEPVYDLVVPTSSDYTIYTYASCCVLVGSVNTTYSITITGKKFTITESTISATRQLTDNVYNETRLTMTLDSSNELIGTTTTAVNCASWYLNQLKKRKDISFDWWSVATLEASDYVKVDTTYDETKTLQTNSIEYDLNTLSAKVKGVI